ncbi:DUF4395 domain-containing protein [Alkalihalobacillus sp. AL-G]|uniref:DUF4395 domain-containing protein n=1 Tax=Alkalihalobacillus sp. AL-G TaxID=2926399 RepID=UPI00272BA792|nr:DUF4395 domain-containing protein [Alkalihalobacillus sp. AL-G]WLD91615.1 DUF4395 domain-containing protein [Alkalihalobacillus sp. AL-G]
MMNEPQSIPRPLVRANQWTIFISVVLTWITGMEWILLVPLLSGILGFFFNFNPVIQIARKFLTRPLKDYVPEDKEQQQFNQAIAVILLSVGFISFLFGWLIAAYIATIMVALASFVAILGFCIGCFIRYRWLRYRHRKAQHHS